jgi:hypothetical protein
MLNPNIRYNPITNKPIVENLRESQQNFNQNNDPSKNHRNTMQNNKSKSNFNSNNNKNTASKQTQNENFHNNYTKSKPLQCNIHHLEIGGCCDNFECISNQQVYCSKCASDPNFCIRNSKHGFIPIDEFISNFTDKELFSLKNDNQFSKSFTLGRKFLENEINIKDDFLEKSRKIQDDINDYYFNLIEYIKSLLEDFNEKFEKFVNQKFSTLMNSFESLNKLTTYEDLFKYDKQKLIEKSSNIPYHEVTNMIINMKKTVYNFQKKNCDSDLDNIKYIIDMNVKNENIFMIKKKFEEIKNEIDTKHLSFCNNLEKNIFFANKLVNASKSITTSNKNNNDYFEETESLGLNNLSLFKEFTIDYSINSNFIDKKFLVFEHSNGIAYMAFPTSQNTIKLISFNKLLKDESFNAKDETQDNINLEPNKRPNEIKHHKATLITSKDFERAEPIDKHLIYKLSSHGGKITHIKYYRLSTGNDQQSVKDLLITASEDKCIKIWDITDLNKYLSDVNKQYRNLCLKTLLAHDNNKISCFVNYFDPLKNKAFIISSGFGDRIKVWDLSTGVITREISDSIKAPNFDNELIVFHENFSAKNFMITSGHNSSIRIWDFDSGKILKMFQYKEKILDLFYFDNQKEKVDTKNNKNYNFVNNFCFYLPKIFLLDDSGKCVSLLFEKDEKGEIAFNLRQEAVNTGSAIRNGGIKWKENKVFFYCKSGQIYEYEIDDLFYYFNSISVNKDFNSLSNINSLRKNENNLNLNKIGNFINLGASEISYCEKFKDLVFGDLLIVHSHDQKIKIFKLT